MPIVHNVVQNVKISIFLYNVSEKVEIRYYLEIRREISPLSGYDDSQSILPADAIEMGIFSLVVLLHFRQFPSNDSRFDPRYLRRWSVFLDFVYLCMGNYFLEIIDIFQK